MKMIKKKCANRKCIQVFKVSTGCKQEYCSGLCDQNKKRQQLRLKRDWNESDRTGDFKERV